MILGLPKNVSSHFSRFFFSENFELKKFVLEKKISYALRGSTNFFLMTEPESVAE